MSRITKDLEEYVAAKPARWPGWAPLLVLPATVAWLGAAMPRWVFMWALAFSIYFGCKWLTWWTDRRQVDALTWKKIGYLLAWPGMNTSEFFGAKTVPRPATRDWIFAIAKTGLGGVLVLMVAVEIPPSHELMRGWVGLVGLVFLLHFGVFHLIALLWQNAGVNAQPIMRAPARATSVSDFWTNRWNLAFNQLVHRYVFRPVLRWANVPLAILAVFLASGLIHDLLLSVPARGGYGWPTVYFLMQSVGLLFERSHLGRRLGLRGGWRGRIFMLTVVAGPVFFLFHPPFLKNVILPMLAAIGANRKVPMNAFNLTLLLQFAGLLHLGLICAGLMMPKAVSLRANLVPLPPFIRRLFWTYYTFIGLCLVSFGVITFAYAGTLAAGGALARALCLFLAVFWSIRLIVATFVFDLRPYLTTSWRRLGYHATNVVFAFLPAVYIWAACHRL